MEVFITGANGLLGHHLVESLRLRGCTVRALVLPTEDASWLERRNVLVSVGDVREPETLAEPMRGVDTVFHLAGMMGMWRPLRDYHAVNVLGTENVCSAAIAANVRRMIHVSSWTVYGMGLGRPATEDFPLRPFPEPYAMTKAEGDKVVQRFITRHLLPAVILRPDTFFGPGDHLHFGRLADRLMAGRGIIIGSGANALPFVHVTDIVQGLLLAADCESAAGQAYNIGHDQPLTQKQLLLAIAQEIGATPFPIYVPHHALYLAATAIEMFAYLTRSGHQPLVTRLGVKLFGEDNRHDIDKARRELGYAPKVALIDGVRTTARWYLRQRTEKLVPRVSAT